MSRRVHHLRPSQFVLTWGPGAILETPSGPRIILSPDRGLFGSESGRPDLRPENFEISDIRMRLQLGKKARIFRLPSNEELGEPHSRGIYRTEPFPRWKLCLNTSKHPHGGAVLHRFERCPVCGTTRGGLMEAIRFVLACPAGHLDDVDWPAVIHEAGSGKKYKECDNRDHFFWYGGGGALSRITIKCPRCGCKANLGDIYSREWPCSGYLPERQEKTACNRKARIVQRQASYLRVPEIRTLFTIPPYSSSLYQLLEREKEVRGMLGSLDEQEWQDRDRILKKFKMLHSGGLIGNETFRQLEHYILNDWEGFRQAWQDMRELESRSQRQDPAGLYETFLLQEFEILRKVVEGDFHPQEQDYFHADPSRVKTVRNLLVLPVNRLRTVIVQVGYRRVVGLPDGEDGEAEVVSSAFCDRDNCWYPGVEFFGEGIFITEKEDAPLRLEGEDTLRWMNAFRRAKEIFSSSMVSFRSREFLEVHPAFVWWHTLAHLLIRAIALEAGYSSASIRERVYVKKDGSHVRGGVLLYATQPGGDGTLGGLISLVPHFQTVLERALQMARYCSGDPLCIETRFEPGTSYNGAACYGCLLLSETSCEHRNMWLDRKVLLENMP